MLKQPSRRELNRARTQNAITGALRELLTDQSIGEITVDQLADRAGISRRTFFNYHGSIAALVGQIFAGYTEALAATALPDDLHTCAPLPAIRRLISTHGIDPEFLGWLALLNCTSNSTEAELAIERAVWAEQADWLRNHLANLLPEGTDLLYIATLAGSIMNAFSAAEEQWLPTLTGSSLTSRDLDCFHELLDRALSYAAAGWQSADPTEGA